MIPLWVPTRIKVINQIIKDSYGEFIYIESNIFNIYNNSFTNCISAFQIGVLFIQHPYYKNIGKNTSIEWSNILQENKFENIVSLTTGAPIYLNLNDLNPISEDIQSELTYQISAKNSYKNCFISYLADRYNLNTLRNKSFPALENLLKDTLNKQELNFTSNPIYWDIEFDKYVNYTFNLEKKRIVIDSPISFPIYQPNYKFFIRDLFKQRIPSLKLGKLPLSFENFIFGLETSNILSIKLRDNLMEQNINIPQNDLKANFYFGFNEMKIDIDETFYNCYSKNLTDCYKTIYLYVPYFLNFYQTLRTPVNNNLNELFNFNASMILDLKVNQNICGIGYVFDFQTRECHHCQPFNQIYDYDSLTCKQCEKGMNCTDPLNITSTDGFFILNKKSNSSQNLRIYECPNPSACINGNKCLDGYDGPLCLSCKYQAIEDIYYYKYSFNQCDKCYKSIWNILFNLFILLASTAFILFIVIRKHNQYEENGNKIISKIDLFEQFLFLTSSVFFLYFLQDRIKDYSYGFTNFYNLNNSKTQSSDNDHFYSYLLSIILNALNNIKSKNCFYMNILGEKYSNNVHIVTFMGLVYYLIMIIIGIITLLFLKKKKVINSFIFFLLKLFGSFIYANLCLPLYFVEFNEEKYLWFDTNQKFKLWNFAWVLVLVIVGCLSLVYYTLKTLYKNRKRSEEEDVSISIICPSYVDFKFIIIKGLVSILFTLGVMIINLFIYGTSMSNDPIIGLLYIFIILLSLSFTIFTLRPYKYNPFNIIEFVVSLCGIIFVFLALLQNRFRYIYENQNEVLIIVSRINLICFTFCFALVIGISIRYYFKNKDSAIAFEIGVYQKVNDRL